jgi:hypothetical protein
MCQSAEKNHAVLGEDVARLLGRRAPQKLSPLQQLVKTISEQTQIVREAIQQRDQLEHSGKLGTMQGIAAQAAVRRDLNELSILGEQMHKMHQEAKVAAESGNNSDLLHWQACDVEGLVRHVEQCMTKEKNRTKINTAASSQVSILSTSAPEFWCRKARQT